MLRGPLRDLAVAVVVVVLGCLSACSTTPASPPSASAPAGEPAAPPVDVGDPVAYAAALVERSNAARAEEGLAGLAASSCAETAAAARAQALVGRAELEHAPLDGVIRDCAPAAKAAENLSRASAPAADVVDAWLGSPGHRDNLLDPDLTDVGVACVPDADALLCSQLFLGP